MKRFLIDFFLVLLLVVLGSSINSSSIDEQIKDFENKNDYLQIHSQANKAVILAQKSGETIESIVGLSVEVIASIFKAIVE